MDSVNRKIKLTANQAKKFNLGSLLRMAVRINEKVFTILFHRDLIFRVQPKQKHSLAVKNIIKQIKKINNLTSNKNYTKIKRILECNKVIEERIKRSYSKEKNEKEDFEDFLLLLKKRWKEIEKLENELKIKVLRSDSLPFCENCYAFRVGRSIITSKTTKSSSIKCPFCGNTLKRKGIKHIPGQIASYLNGPWLEDYIGELLKKVGWNVWVSIYVFGSSSVPFEIDLLAIKDGYTLIGECKTGKVGLKDVSAFMSKFYDVQCNYALFCSLSELDPQPLTLMKKNPAFSIVSAPKKDSVIIKILSKIKTKKI